MSLAYHITTYGCQMNVHDSEVMAGLLEDLGYRRASGLEEADVIILNTCCVRETAEQRILGRLGELGRLKRSKPNLVLVVAGCLGQAPGAVERIRRRAAHVDVIMGTHNLHRLPDLIEETLRRQGRARTGSAERAEPGGRTAGAAGPVVEIWSGSSEAARTAAGREGLPVRRKPGVTAWVTVMYGCDSFCSYCVVPAVRGRERSRLPEDIHREVEGLVQDGYREVTLLGQNVNAYGRDLGPGPGRTFADLLRRLEKIDGLLRIRYTTSHPRDFGDDIIDAVAGGRKICEHFHLPAQSGSTRILRRMNRGYSREDYLGLIDRIRRRVPAASFSTDLMVGYPGETDADFADTISLVQEVRFDSAFTFAYSPRPETPAARETDQIPDQVKEERLGRLIKIQNEVSLTTNQGYVGRKVQVLVEGAAEKSPGLAAGRTRTNKLVLFRPPAGSTVPGLVGLEAPVVIEKASTWSLEGRGVAPGE